MPNDLNEKKEELSKFLMKQILNEASSTLEERRERYGRPYENHKRIADLWNAYFTGTKRSISPADVAIGMILVKIARLQESPEHYDSLMDIAAYAAVAHSIIGEENFDD